MSYYPDNIKPLTDDEIIENFQHVLNNLFEHRSIVGSTWNVYTNYTSHKSFFSYSSNYYSQGYHTNAILLDSKGEKDIVKFFKFFRRGRWEYGYSFTKRELTKELLKDVE